MSGFTPANDFTGAGSTYDTTYPAFGVTAYKNYESMLGRNMLLSEHIDPCVEMFAGAHYYAQGQYTSTYKKAEITVNFSDVAVDTKVGKRNGYISLNIVGIGVCDMGIQGKTSATGVTTWKAFGYSHTLAQSTVLQDVEQFSQSELSSVKIVICPVREGSGDVVHGYYTWTKLSGEIITESISLTGTVGQLFGWQNEKPLVRFTRFMSLVPTGGSTITADTNDNSSFTGKITAPKLYTTDTTYVNWGIARMDYVWSVQGWNINTMSCGDTDTFSCTHSHFVYNAS